MAAVMPINIFNPHINAFNTMDPFIVLKDDESFNANSYATNKTKLGRDIMIVLLDGNNNMYM